MPDPARPATRPRLRRLGVVLGVWVALTAGALLAASALDSPVGEGARDAARPAAPGPTATPGATPGGLPPLALVLDRDLPADIRALPSTRRFEALRVRAMTTRSAERFVELGSALQRIGDAASAEASYRAALMFDPGSVEARVGLALVEGARGPAGLVAGSRQLAELARANPRDQLVSFNRGWLEVYRRRGGQAAQEWRRTVALGPQTRLGRTAASLLRALANGPAGRNP